MGSVTVRVAIKGGDKRTIAMLRSLAFRFAGFPASSSMNQITAHLRRTGTCTYTFPNKEKAAEFRKNVDKILTAMRAKIKDDPTSF